MSLRQSRISLNTMLSSLVLVVVLGCHANDESMLRSGGNLQKKPVLLTDSAKLKGSSSMESVVAHVTYLIDVRLNSGLTPCPGGEITLGLTDKFTFTMPNSKIQCLSADIDISALLGSALANGGAGQFDPQALKSDGLMFSLSEVAGATFDPPRPLLIGPIVQDTAALVGLNKTISSTVTVEHPNDGEPTSATGRFHVQVLDVGGAYQNHFLKEPLTNVLHWKLETAGFDGVSPAHGILIREMEFFWNLRPIMVPRIRVSVDNIGAFVSGGSAADISALVGAVTISLTVKDYDL